MSKKMLLVVLGMLIVLLSACTSGPANGGANGAAIGGPDGEGAPPPISASDSSTLRLAFTDEQSFYMQFGNSFRSRFPKLQLEVLPLREVLSDPDPVKAMQRFVEEEHPDVVWLTQAQYASLAAEGALYDLEPGMKRDGFDLDGIEPGILELIRGLGEGRLYGLGPQFTSNALYYNKTMFDKYGVPYPDNRMSYEDLLKLASRFPHEGKFPNETFGLFQSAVTRSAFELIRAMGEAKSMMYADMDSGKMTLDTPEWRSVFEQVIEGYRSGAVALPADLSKYQNFSEGGPMQITFAPGTMNFMQGLAAMTLDSSIALDMLGAAGSGITYIDEEGNSGIGAFEWDIVEGPVDPSRPNVTGSILLTGLFGIPVSADNKEAAWEFVKLANSPEMAKTLAMTAPSLSVRPAFKRNVDKNLDAFYALSPNPLLIQQPLPVAFQSAFSKLADREIRAVVDGTASLEQLLAALQQAGQQLLDEQLGKAQR